MQHTMKRGTKGLAIVCGNKLYNLPHFLMRDKRQNGGMRNKKGLANVLWHRRRSITVAKEWVSERVVVDG